MGSSGAGKTTLMDVLAARKDEGVISGVVRLNGHMLPLSFQRTTGYCEQVDVHLPTATVREALEFSALIRQPRRYSREEKLAYVDTILDLLELQSYSDAIIGRPGAGLGVELRKRLTIGVELVSKPWVAGAYIHGRKLIAVRCCFWTSQRPVSMVRVPTSSCSSSASSQSTVSRCYAQFTNLAQLCSPSSTSCYC